MAHNFHIISEQILISHFDNVRYDIIDYNTHLRSYGIIKTDMNMYVNYLIVREGKVMEG